MKEVVLTIQPEGDSMALLLNEATFQESKKVWEEIKKMLTESKRDLGDYGRVFELGDALVSAVEKAVPPDAENGVSDLVKATKIMLTTVLTMFVYAPYAMGEFTNEVNPIAAEILKKEGVITEVYKGT